MSTLGMLPTTPRGALMGNSVLTPAPVAIDTRQQWLVGSDASARECSKLNDLYQYPKPGASVGRVGMMEHAHGRGVETFCRSDVGQKPVDDTTILTDETVALRAAKQWATTNKI